MAFNNTVVARAAAAIWGVKLGYATMQAALDQANSSAGGVNSVINGAFNDSFRNVSNAAVAATVVSNLGLTGAAATEGTAYLVAQMASVPVTERGAKISEVVALFSGLTGDANYGAAATAFNVKVAGATAYSSTPGTQDAALGFLPSENSFFLTLGQDNVTGTAAADTFNAYIFDNNNSLQSADRVDGGAGTDTLSADMGASQLFAVTPITSRVENIVIRAESEAAAQGQNNVGGTARVQIDAERINGATRFESNNSRSDVIIEDVRILPSQITKDITVAFVESDPGHVDYAVYFDQYSLKNQTSASSSINLQIMDTGAAASGLAPLLNSNYRAFTFTVTPPGGAARVVTLGSDAIQNALTYVELAAAFQLELNREFGAGVATATVGTNFTVVDPLSGSLVTGQSVVLSTQSASAFTTPAGSGWLADGTAPPASNFYTNFTTGATSSADLVTVKVLLDDVGRGSTGGDLVIGGLSTGVTSSSLGVQRFEVQVLDNSKLESMKSTNNTLREVTIVNGATSNSGYAHVPTVKDAGNLTVNGNSGVNGANVTGTGAGGVAFVDGQGAGNNLPLPNTGPTTNFGFTDVRLIDGSAMTGMLAFSAEVTNNSLAKYLNLRDIQALPAGDNVAFTYNGGTNNDTLWVALDSNATGSRNTIMAGREDFTFTTNGGAGNDNLTVFVGGQLPFPGAGNNLAGGFQNWYINQALNKNITVDGGAGNDTIRTPGAGDKIIIGGLGNDTVYADNSGVQANTSATASRAGAVYTAAEAAELAQILALAMQSNSTNSDGGLAFQAPLGQPDATVATLNALNLFTPVSFNDPAIPANPNPLLPTKAALRTEIDNAFAAGAITVQQQLALYTAYNVATGATITTPGTLVVPTLTGAVAVAGALTASEFAAGNTALDALIVAAKAAAATADAVDAQLATQGALLNATQLAVVNANLAVNGVASAQLVAPPGAGVGNGTLTNLNNLNALKAALVVGATDTAVVAALTAAVANGAITGPLNGGQSQQLYTASGATGAVGNLPIDANELGAIQLILEPLIATATALNTTATAALTAAVTANNAVVRTASGAVGASPVAGDGVVVGAVDSIGQTETENARLVAVAARDALQGTTVAPAPGTLNFLTTIQTDLVALKAALTVGITELNFNLLTTAAVAKGTITAGDKAAIDAAGSSGAPAFPGTNQTATEKQAVDVLIQALQEANTAAVDNVRAQVAVLQATVDATTLASAQAASAALDAPVAGAPAVPTDKAVFVVNTANQLDVTLTPGTGYVLAVNDERNVSDLRSDANDVRNMFNTTVTVTFKDLVATALVPNTGYKTSDLQINQAIKDAINNNAVLSKLLVAADGPANTLTITSLIDGVMATTNLSIAVTLPTLTSLTTTDIAAAAVAYGLPATTTGAELVTVMTTSLAAFNTKGDYVDQLAETGAFGGNVRVTGAASVTTADNTITPGDGNDVTVLGTTSDATGSSLLSSNDTVVFGAAFGNDTIVHFKAGSLGTGGDILNLSALGGRILGTAFNVDKSVNVANEVAATNGTTTLVAGLFTDSTTAQTHVYVAVDPLTNIGKVYQVVDAAGVGAGSVTATLAGTIDLADTLWSTLTTDNFA